MKPPPDASRDPVPIVPVPSDAPEPRFRHSSLGDPACVWTYRGFTGETLFHVCRYDKAGGGKDVLPLSFCRNPNGSSGWRFKRPPAPVPLYGLDRLAHAQRETPVLLLEGEKAADAALQLLGGAFACLTWCGGTGNVGHADFSPLRGRKVLVWPDADPPGWKAGGELHEVLRTVGASSIGFVLAPHGAPSSWDVADTLGGAKFWTPSGAAWEPKDAGAWIQENPVSLEQFRAEAARYGVGEGERLATGATAADVGFTQSAPRSQELAQKELEAGLSQAAVIFPRRDYPWDALPVGVSACLRNLASAIGTSPTALPGIAFTVLGAAFGRSVSAGAKLDWREPLIFWCGDIRESGEGKSPCMARLIAPLEKWQREEDDRARREKRDYDALSAREKKVREPPPLPRSLVVTDTTLEGLHTALDDHPTGGVLMSLEELSSFVSSQNQYKRTGGNDREAWLKLYDGNDARILRVGRVTSIHGARVSMCGGIQPGVFARVFGGGGGTYLVDGTIFRFLYTYEPPSFHEVRPDSLWPETDRALWERIVSSALDFAERRAEKPLPLLLTREAQEFFFEWRNDVQARKMDLPGPVRGFIPKWIGSALRISGVLHCLGALVAGEEPLPFIERETVEEAVSIVLFHAGHTVDALQLLLCEEPKQPVEVSERALVLAETLRDLHPQVDGGYLAVGFLHEHFNARVRKNDRIASPRAFGSFIRTLGLDIATGKHMANGRRSVRCLEWNDRAESLIKSHERRPPPGEEGSESEKLSEGDEPLSGAPWPPSCMNDTAEPVLWEF